MENWDPLLRSVSRGQIEAFLHWRRTHKPDGTVRKTRISGRVIEKDRAMAHNLFAFAERWDLIDSNPVAKTKPPKYDKRQYVILKDDEYQRLLAECDENPFLRLFVLLLGETGMRCESEGLWLRWENVDFEEGFIWIASSEEHRTKSGQGRWVPMTRRLGAALREHSASYRMRLYGGARTPWVFHHPYARRRAEAGERIGSLRRAFDAAAERAELPKGFTQHDLRHRRITMWLAAGKSAVLVKEAVGHSDLRITMAYTHLVREHLRSLVEAHEVKKGELDELVS